LTLPFYLLAPIVAVAGAVIGQFAPTWLPDWLQFIHHQDVSVRRGLGCLSGSGLSLS
jgi:hypothetical protein